MSLHSCAAAAQSGQDASDDEENSIEASISGGGNMLLEEGNDFRRSWCEYAGDPLVLSHADFSQLCERAGSIYRPMEHAVTQALRPLVKDYVLPLTPRLPEEEQVDAAG